MRRKLELHPEGFRSGSKRQMPRIRLLAFTASAALAFCAAVGASPDEVLYDQHDNAGTVSSNSQDYESALNTFDTELADDFAVPAGPGWNVTAVEVQGVYAATAATIPASTATATATARCRVPRVIGLRLGVAKTRIRRARCSVGRIRRVRSRRALRGRVVGQSPRPRAIRRRGFPVRLLVGQG
jgi:PASTA domain